eukprot:3688852-Rhodomonas_salina.1
MAISLDTFCQGAMLLGWIEVDIPVEATVRGLLACTKNRHPLLITSHQPASTVRPGKCLSSRMLSHCNLSTFPDTASRTALPVGSERTAFGDEVASIAVDGLVVGRVPAEESNASLQ